MIINLYKEQFLSFEPIGIKDRLSFNNASFSGVEPIIFSKLLVGLFSRVHFIECEVIVALMFFPLFWDFSSSPKPNSVNFEVSFNSIDSVSGETILSEVIDVSDMSVFKI